MKIFLGFIAFTLTFGLSASLVGILFGFPQPEVKSYVSDYRYDSVHTNKIERFLKRDVRNGDLRNDAAFDLFAGEESIKEYRKSVNDYYIKSSSMNDSNMPEDFKYAWREHMNAWKDQASYLNSLEDNADILGTNPSAKNYSDNTDEINKTWYQVLRIADRYGVDIDRSYYR